LTTHTAEIPPFIVTRTRVVAFLFIILIPVSVFGMIYVPSALIVSGDAATTARNILASETLFRLGIVSSLLGQLVDTMWALVLYQLLKPVNKNMAVLMVIFLLLGVPIAMLNELNQFAVLLLSSGADYLRVFTPGQLHALESLFLNLHDNGIKIAGLFWGIWLLPYGYLVFKSGFLPRFLGVLLIIGCFGYLIQSFVAFLAPNLVMEIAWLPVLTSWGELLLPLWLLIKGVNVEQWEKRALAFA
jgi:hypothetical protein